jgi:hypothetical protein
MRRLKTAWGSISGIWQCKSIPVKGYEIQALSTKPTPEREVPMQTQDSKNILIISVSCDFKPTLSSNILYISQHEGAELFDSPPVAGRAREAYS